MSKSTFVKIIILLVLIVSCNNKETKIKSIETLVNETKEKYETYNQKDWDNADTLIVALEKDIEDNRSNYTSEQIEKANTLIGKYKALKMKNGLNSLKKSMEDVGQQIKGAMEVLTDTTSSN
jgi:hypothetical protein